MRKSVILSLGVIAVLAGCQFEESYQEDSLNGFDVSLESIISEPETKTYADEQHLVVWHNDDRVSVFEKKEYWEEYKYTGRTGTTGARLTKLSSEGSGTGGDLDYYYAVYPHSELNGFNSQGHLLLTLPHEQPYDEFSFGRGTNLMVSSSEDDSFKFKNIGGYLVFKLYGEGVSVSSIRLAGNSEEEITGDIDVVISPGVDPVTKMSTARYAEKYNDAVLVCDPPIALGATAAEYKEFWFVLPPMTFEGGFSIEVTTADGDVWTKTTEKSWTITRNHYTPVSAMEVIMAPNQGSFIEFADLGLKNILVSRFDTNDDGEISYEEAEAVTDIGVGYSSIRSFDEFRFFKNVTEIKADAFRQSGYNYLTSIILPDSITTIGPRAFGNLAIGYIKFPKSLSYIGENAFLNGWVGTIEIADLAAWCNVSFNGVSACPSLTHFWFDGTSPDPTLLVNGEEVTSLIIPEGVSKVSSIVFAGYNQIESIHLPSSIETIGESAFWSCKSLRSVNIPISLKTISGYAFRGCTSLERFEVEDLAHWCSVEKKGDLMGTYDGEYPQDFGLWYNGEYIEELVIPEGVVCIEDYTFANCRKITHVSIPESTEEIGTNAFAYCTSLSNINIPNNLRTIGSGAFIKSAILSISLPDTIECFDGAFRSCQSLASITLPSNISSIGPLTFAFCQSLSSITIPNSVTSIGYSAFNGCSNLGSVNIPENVTTIEGSVFMGCSNLSSVTFPHGITSIGERSFENCTSLQKVSLPESLTSIGSRAFYGCSSLWNIIINSPQTVSGYSNMFDNTNSCPIYVHTELVETYKSSNYWSNYSERIRGFDDPGWIVGAVPFPGYAIMAMEQVNVRAGQTVNANMTLWDGGEGYVCWMTGQTPQYVNGVDEGTLDDNICHTYTEDYFGYIYALSFSGRYSLADGMTLTIISIE